MKIRNLRTLLYPVIVAGVVLWAYHDLLHEKFHFLTKDQIDNLELVVLGTILSVLVERIMEKLFKGKK